jgi:hypothetical protein
MYIINETYFNGAFNVPNVDELNTDTKANLELIIDDKARLFLQDALGYELFTDLDQYVVNGVFVEEINIGTEDVPELQPTPQKWLDFVNGKEYTLNGNTYKWQGLIYENGGLKKSILTDFCYYHWLLEKVSEMYGVGDAVAIPKNAVRVNPTQRIVTTWNNFVEKNQKDISAVANKTVSYLRGVRFTDYYSSNSSRYVSLVKYLEDNKEDYPNVTPRYYETKNQLGL